MQRSGMTLSRAARLLTITTDALALSALWAAGEWREWMLPAVIVLGVLGLLWRTVFQYQDFVSKRVGLALISVFLVAAAVFAIRSRWHPVLVAAHLSPLLHVCMLWGVPNLRNRNWRLVFAFINIVLATALSPDLYLAFSIFAYVMLASLTLGCHTLESEFREHSPQWLERPVPARFFSFGAVLAAAVFIGSLVIFPLLPRVKGSALGWGWESMPGQSRVGYTEEVDLRRWTQLNGTGEGATVLRLYFPDGPLASGVSGGLYGGLIRGQALDLFDGGRWQVRWKKRGESGSERPPHQIKNARKIEIIREPIGGATLPVPYGVSQFELISDSGPIGLLARPQGKGWQSAEYSRKRVQYKVLISENLALGGSEFDPPEPVHTQLPEEWRNPSKPWKTLVDRIVASGKRLEDRLEAVRQHFRMGRFGVSTGGTDLKISDAKTDAAESARKNLTWFLFESRSGHCELFSSSAAILLRMAGVPSRVVVGFRSIRMPVSGVLMVREGDAHAWVEAWNGKQWVPLDLTPVVEMPGRGIFDFFNEAKELASAYWYRNVLSFEQQSVQEQGMQIVKETWSWIQGKPSDPSRLKDGAGRAGVLSGAMLAVFAAVVIAAVLIWRRSGAGAYPWLYSPRARRLDLRSRRIIFEYRMRLRSALADSTEEQKIAAELWRRSHERLRFGPDLPGSAEWKRGLQELDRAARVFAQKSRSG